MNFLKIRNISNPFFQILQLRSFLSNRRKKQVYFIFLLILISGFLESFSLSLFLPFSQIIISPKDFNKLFIFDRSQFLLDQVTQNQIILIVGFTFIFLVILSTIIKIANLWLINRLVALMATELATTAYKKTIYQPYQVHISRNTSKVISSIVTETDYCVSALNSFLLFTNALLISFFLVFTLLVINPTLTTVLFLFLFLGYVVISYLTSNLLISNGKKISIGYKKQLQTLREGLASIKEILLSNNQSFYLDIFKAIDYKLRIKITDNKFIGAYPRYLFEGIILFILSFFIVYLRLNNSDFNSYLPLIVTAGLGVQKLLPVLQQIYLNYSQIRATSASVKSLLDLLSQPVAVESKFLKKNVFKNRIIFKNVSFAFNNSSIKVVKNISFEILKGEKIGIKGTTGSGKTTIIDLLMGLLTPTEGTILVDNTDINADKNIIFMRSWRKSLSHVPQITTLIDGTIKQNIALGVPPELIDEKRIMQAARKAKISDFIEGLEHGYYSEVGEKGIKMSGGQRQRIIIARAFYRNADVLILDEATSALDSKTEKDVTSNLDFKSDNITLITIAHRLETLKNYDRVFEINNGNLINIETKKNKPKKAN